MKKFNLIILLFFSFILNSCTKKIPKRIPSSYAGQDVNVQFIKPPRKASQFLDVINLAVTSASYGFWVNQTLNGSGTMVLRNPTVPESAPKQFNRALSLFDLYFTHGVLNFENSKQNGNHYFWLYTPLEDFRFINTQEEYEFPFRREVMDYAHRLFPIIEKQIFKKLSMDNYTLDKENIIFNDDVRKLLLTEQKNRLLSSWQDIFQYNEDPNYIIKKIDTYKKAFSPLSVLFELKIDRKEGSFQNIRLTLPGPSTITGLETKDVSKIKLKPGLDLKFKKPIVGKFITLEKATYLDDENIVPETLSNKVMQVDIHKNYKYKDLLKLDLTFGSIDPDINPEKAAFKSKNKKILRMLPINNKDRSAALILDGYINISDLKLKKLNKYLGKFKVRTYIHKLGLVLKREKKTKSFQEAFREHPTFNMKLDSKRSLISMRATKGANSILHVKFLVGAGFVCKSGSELERDPDVEKLPGYKYTCKSDLSNFKDFNEKFK
ncbi:MAG: hypothetical protein OEY33_07850, partial [Bdellovibrionales bacterium]|nr:hypothetical protein [Bdellovibrionales bacterium]